MPKQPLPRDPDLILATKPDEIARGVGGTLDYHFAHQANSIATGFLGRQEIVVTAYDDGSVFAYYVGEIAEYIRHLLSGGVEGKPKIPTWFFHENVGSSAWGLAIHQASRLIAVSSNRYEVTVFAFGLTKQPRGRKKAVSRDYSANSVVERKRNWRIVLLLGEGGHNIPNITFWDDRDGQAEKVCAMDIKGQTWILDIWNPCTAPLKIPHMYQPRGQRHAYLSG